MSTPVWRWSKKGRIMSIGIWMAHDCVDSMIIAQMSHDPMKIPENKSKDNTNGHNWATMQWHMLHTQEPKNNLQCK